MRTKSIITALTAGLAILAMAGLVATPASAAPLFTQGEKTSMVYNNSPLRTCASTGCGVLAYMPKTTSLQPGGGYATFAKAP